MTYPSQPTPPGPGESGLPPSQPWPGNSALPPSVTTMPPPYPPTSGALLPPPPPPGAAQRNPRTFLAVSAVVVLAFITFFTMPGAVAGGVRSASTSTSTPAVRLVSRFSRINGILGME